MPRDQIEAPAGAKESVPEKSAPAAEVAFTVNLDGRRQMVVRTVLAADLDQETANKALDSVAALVDRQRAKYEVKELLKGPEGLQVHLKGLRNFKDNLGVLDAKHAKATAEIDVKIEEILKDRKSAFEKGYNAHVDSGRTGEFKAKGATLSDLNRYDTMVKQETDRKDKLEAEKEQTREQINKSIERFETEIVRLVGEINECKEILGEAPMEIPKE